MKTKYVIFTIFTLFFSVFSFGLVQDIPEVELGDPAVLIGMLTPLVTLGVVWVVKKLSILSGVYTLIVVTLVAGLFTLVTNHLSTDLSWIVQFLLGLVSVFLNQVYRQLTSNS